MFFLYSSLNRLKITQNKMDVQLAELTNITSEENKRAIRLPFHRVRRLDVRVNLRIQNRRYMIAKDGKVCLVDLTWILNVCEQF